MDQEDPEKRIADLERQLSDMNPPPPQVDAPQQGWAPPPPPQTSWQPSSSGSSSFGSPSFGSLSFGPSFSRRRSNPVLWIALLVPIVGLVIAGIAVFGSLSSVGSMNPFSSGPQLHTPDGLNEMLASERSRFGDNRGYRIVVYPEYAILDRADPQDNRRKKSYDYRGGEWTDWTNGSVSSSDTEADLSKFDVTAVLATLNGAAKSFDFNNPESTYLIVEGKEDGSLGLSIYVSDHGLSGYMEVNPAGSVKKAHPPS
jgi:hypothetical protein